MKTNAQFDDAWRDLINARRGEDINAVHAAAERVAHASRMLQLEQGEVKEICDHHGQFDARGVCRRCGYNASQFIQIESTDGSDT